MEEAKSSEEKLIEERKEKFVKSIKTNFNYVSYLILAIIVWVAVRIRTSNLQGLKDVTTGSWTLGPDLDPFLFLRWAKTIVAQGSLPLIDTMRYVPLGFNVKQEVLLHPYFIAYFHKLAATFGSTSVTYSAIIYPVFMFALTVIAFFFFVRKIFIDSFGVKKANIIALISSFFLSVIPSLLPRTIAGIPEKESSGFLFLFLSFYLFLSAWKSKKLKNQILLSFLAAASTAIMAGVWGGYVIILFTIPLSIILAFLLGQLEKDKFYIYSVWLFFSFFFMNFVSLRYSVSAILTSTTTLIPIGIFILILMHYLLFSTSLKNYFYKGKIAKLPPPLASLLITVLLGIILSMLFFGPGYIKDKANDLTKPLIQPITDRLGVTVAENRQPFFAEWAYGFGPVVKGIPLTFWLMIISSLFLYSFTLSIFSKKERIIMSSGYAFFLLSLIFSRYTPSGLFNGTNRISIAFYFTGIIILIITFGYYYFEYHRKNEESRLKEINFAKILLFSFFFLSLVSARGAVRLIMVLVPPASILVSYLFVTSISYANKSQMKIFSWVMAGIVITASVFSAQQFYIESKGTANSYIPSSYTVQWQKAMSWVRENTPKNAIFSHWWDYGYWVQSIGERATFLDGGNSYSYWNHLLGRHVLTTPDSYDAMEYLYSHNTTHLLIDPTDIGKYAAFSSIGSDENYDRYSFLNVFARNDRQSPPQETKNSTIYFFFGGSPVEDDIFYDLNGTRIILPGSPGGDKTGIGAIIVEKDNSGNLNQPYGIFIYQGKQYRLPLRYAYSKGELVDFGSGVPSGVFLMPLVNVLPDGRASIENDAVLIYLSNRTVKSLLARLYLYNLNDPYFKLVHSEDDAVVSQLKASNSSIPDILYFQGIRGPIRIWEVKYPENVEFKEEYLKTEYPNKSLSVARQF